MPAAIRDGPRWNFNETCIDCSVDVEQFLKPMCSYFSLVDGLRRAPSSFAHLVYHSQMPYQFTPRGGSENRAVRFRLIPGGGGSAAEEEDEATASESGLADDGDQEKPWEAKERRANERRDPFYLRTEFIKRLRRDEPIRYILQMQLAPATDHAMWNPQKVSSPIYSRAYTCSGVLIQICSVAVYTI